MIADREIFADAFQAVCLAGSRIDIAGIPNGMTNSKINTLKVVVSRLMRVRYGPVVLPERLKTCTFYELTDKELDLLFEFAGLERNEPVAVKVEPETRRVQNPRKR